MPLLSRSDASGKKLTPAFSSMLLATTFLNQAQELGYYVKLDYIFPADGRRVAESMVQAGDADRRSILRLLTAGTGLSQNWANTPALQAWLERALTIHPNVVVETVDPSGREIVGVVGHGEVADTVTRSRDLSAWPR